MGHAILIAHPQAALRRALRTLLGFLPCVGAIHDGADRAQVVAQVAALQPDVVVVVLDGTEIIEPVRQVRAAGFGGRIVALATDEDAALHDAAAAAGVDVVQNTVGGGAGWLHDLHRNVCGSPHDPARARRE